MDEFLKELTELCKKYNKYIQGDGMIDSNGLYVEDSNNIEDVLNEKNSNGVFIKLGANGYEINTHMKY